MGERLVCNQKVSGSIPLTSTRSGRGGRRAGWRGWADGVEKSPMGRPGLTGRATGDKFFNYIVEKRF